MGKLDTQNSSLYRLCEINNVYNDGINMTPYRTEYRRDYARVLHCPSFRRLESKTQLFPGHESDFFRNRLTHSLEVAQISKSIANKFISYDDRCSFIEADVCEVAGLIHDIGHPPFGHNGEKALDDCMKTCGGFEGNAQTLHIITRLEKKELPVNGKMFDNTGNDCRCGLNLTVRSIASALKYDDLIPIYRDKSSGLQKGYYKSDDDIAYSTYDLEDAFKAGFLTPYKMMAANDLIYQQICEKLEKDGINSDKDECRNMIITLFADVWQDEIEAQKRINTDDTAYIAKTITNFLNSYDYSEKFASDGYLRTKFSSFLISKFVEGLSIDICDDNPVLSKINVDKDIELLVNILKHFTYVCLINSSRLKVVENRGYEIIKKMFDRLAVNDGYKLLPEDFQIIYEASKTDEGKKRVICDFIAGMTDRYAVEFYGRLFSENPQTIFKPL